MTSERSATVTLLLRRMRNGDEAAVDELLPRVYGELSAIARRIFRAQRLDHTLQAIALVRGACLNVLGSAGASEGFHDRVHFVSFGSPSSTSSARSRSTRPRR